MDECKYSPRKNKKNGWSNHLKPLSSKKLKKYDFVGFDVETFGKFNEFYLGGLYWYTKSGKEKFKTFYDKRKMIDFLLSSKKFEGKYVVATNLNFDLTCLFYDMPEWNDLEILKQQSNIIYAKLTRNKKKRSYIKFIDTFNYLKTSVEGLGKIINSPKLKKPETLGKIPETVEQRKELEIYNKRDCKISCDFMYFLQKGINKAGGNLKITIASTSFDVWRRNFLPIPLMKENSILKDKSIRDFIFEGYYGGRTEVFKRGEFKNVYYYDINSLYPSVMRNEYPLPQSVRKIKNPKKDNILNYDGVSKVLIYCPKNIRPLLPFKHNGKLIFPSGYIHGTYNHNELRKALEIGYKLINIDNQIIYTQTFKLFNKFVDYFYKIRQKYKSEGNNLQITFKLILNSLYGKFGQKKISCTKILNPSTLKVNNYNQLLEKINEFVNGEEYETDEKGRILVNYEKKYDGNNVYPIIASYVTSYARILMYDYIKYNEVIYTDTDSCICEKPLFEHSKELGKMKQEGFFENCYIIKPKLYFLGGKEQQEVKIKGLSKPSKKDFFSIVNGNTVKKIKFAKLNESFRRGMKVNQAMEVVKSFNLEDDKRIWNGKTSKPLYLWYKE